MRADGILFDEWLHHSPALLCFDESHGHRYGAPVYANDRNMVSQCLLYRYAISYKPYNFKGHLDDYPLTMAYGKQMDALRMELRDYFWDGEFRHEVGATVTAGGKSHHPYAVFASRETGTIGVAIANYDEESTITVQVALDSGASLSRYRLVDDPAWRDAGAGIVIPPCSAAVVT